MVEENENIPYLSKWENITADKILYPTLMHWCRIFMDSVFFISCIMYSFTAYVIIKKSSKAMGKYKYILLTQLTSNMFVEIFIFVANPIVLMPLPLVTYFSHFSLKPEWMVYLAGLNFLPSSFIFTTFTIALGSRVLAISDAAPQIYCYLEKHLIKFITAVIIYTLFGAFNIMSALSFVIDDPYKIKSLFIKAAPATKIIYEYLPITYGVYVDSRITTLCSINALLYFFWLFITVISAVVFNIFFLYRMQQIKRIVSKQTHNHQKMLYKCIVVQFLNAVILALIPIGICILIFLFGISSANWMGYIFLPILSLHVIADCFTLLYFVKPYRMFISGFFLPKRNYAIKSNIFIMH